MTTVLERKVKTSDTPYSYDEAVELTGHGRYNYLLLAACCVISNAMALDMFGFSVVVAAASCDLHLGITETGLLASAPFAGVLFAFPWGYFADTQGRRRALLLSTSGGFIFAALSSLAPTWQIMLALKIIGCSFSTSSFSLTMAYLGESTGSKHRSRYLFIMISMNIASEIVSFGLAYFILPLSLHWEITWLSLTYRSWRLYTFVIAVPLGIGALLLTYLYESPKFLANKGEINVALKVLRKIYVANGGKDDDYPVHHLEITENANSQEQTKKNLWSSLVSQTVPLFQPPLLLRTLQLFYLIVICCTTNNVFLMWFPTMVNLFFNSVSGGTTDVGFCEGVVQNATNNVQAENFICNDAMSPNTVYSGIILGFFFTFVNLMASRLASWRRLVLIGCYLVAAISSILVGIVTKPVWSMIFFSLIQITCVGIGSVASYFVDMYPTTYRGLVTSLGMMVARLSSFAGVNVIGVIIVDHCNLTFYCWSIVVLSGVAVALFLPSDRKK
ncbi:unnamed protein product [Parnassius apollo]|uniref:(apollo) hypothetical protein n=1 Tax=Parnassius apollo TaxID=110799 RepID=A0A8S3XNX1_PARAO|nr:unnamed protein product [Parnassius apollo]